MPPKAARTDIPHLDLDELVTLNPLATERIERVEQLSEDNPMPLTTRHDRVPLRTLYDPLGRPRHVPISNVLPCLANGLSLRCPKCQGQHDTTNPNDCAGKAAVKGWRCPICANRGVNKVLWDVQETAAPVMLGDDPNLIEVGEDMSTPEQRLLVKRNVHMAWYHRNEAMALGIPVEAIRAL